MVENLTVARVPTDQLNREFKSVANRVWGTKWQVSVPADKVADVVQDLWVKYYSTPSFRQVLDECANGKHRRSIIRAEVITAFSEMAEADLLADNMNLYSVDSVKAALKDASSNKHLLDILPEAMARLRLRYAPYAEAIVDRYANGNVPESGSAAQRLTNAHTALTEEVNRTVRKHEYERAGTSLKNAVPAEERKGKGATSDPTAAMAMAVMASDEVRETFYGDDEYPIPYREVHEPSPSVPMNIFDHELQGMAQLDNYRASVFPELYPNERADYLGE